MVDGWERSKPFFVVCIVLILSKRALSPTQGTFVRRECIDSINRYTPARPASVLPLIVLPSEHAYLRLRHGPGCRPR